MRECDDCGSRISGDGCGFCQRFNAVMTEYDEKNYRISHDDLLDDLRDVADELGTTPSKKQYTDSGEYHARTYIKRFGKWNDAVRAAGLLPNAHRKDGSKKALGVTYNRRVEAEGGS